MNGEDRGAAANHSSPGKLGGETGDLALRGSGMERRRHPRVPWQHESLDGLLLEVEEHQESWRTVPFTLVDLAAGGVGVMVGEPLEPGSRVRVTFPLPDDTPARPTDQLLDVSPWSALAEVVHARESRDLPKPVAAPLPAATELPHHRGVRFQQLEDDSELRLLRALYGRLPAGWAVEQYHVRRPGGQGDVARYAVLRDGQRVAQGFSTYERARGRSTSMHMDEVAETRSRKASGGGAGATDKASKGQRT